MMWCTKTDLPSGFIISKRGNFHTLPLLDFHKLDLMNLFMGEKRINGTKMIEIHGIYCRFAEKLYCINQQKAGIHTKTHVICEFKNYLLFIYSIFR